MARIGLDSSLFGLSYLADGSSLDLLVFIYVAAGRTCGLASTKLPPNEARGVRLERVPHAPLSLTCSGFAYSIVFPQKHSDVANGN